MQNEKEIKHSIRQLQRLKRKTRVGSPTRRDLNRKIRELGAELNNIYGDMTPEKKELIEKIYKAKPHFKKLKIDLRKFTEKELQYHYDTKIKKERQNET